MPTVANAPRSKLKTAVGVLAFMLAFVWWGSWPDARHNLSGFEGEIVGQRVHIHTGGGHSSGPPSGTYLTLRMREGTERELWVSRNHVAELSDVRGKTVRGLYAAYNAKIYQLNSGTEVVMDYDTVATYQRKQALQTMLIWMAMLGVVVGFAWLVGKPRKPETGPS
jgi:hypothetical protein